MFQEQCDPQIEGKVFSYGVFQTADGTWKRGLDDYSWQITLEDGKEEDEEERGGGSSAYSEGTAQFE